MQQGQRLADFRDQVESGEVLHGCAAKNKGAAPECCPIAVLEVAQTFLKLHPCEDLAEMSAWVTLGPFSFLFEIHNYLTDHPEESEIYKRDLVGDEVYLYVAIGLAVVIAELIKERERELPA